MPAITPEQHRATKRRKAILSWVPIALVAVGLVVVVITAATASGWWWFQDDRDASADQVASDSSTVFTGPGLDYLGVDGVLRVKVRDDALPATELGLGRDDERAVEPRVPLRAIVSAPEGGFTVDLVTSFTVRSHDDRLSSVTTDRAVDGGFRGAIAYLRGEAPDWGWSAEQLDALETEVVERQAAAGGGGAVAASLEPVPMHGAFTTATVTVVGASAQIGFTVASTLEEASAIVAE